MEVLQAVASPSLQAQRRRSEKRPTWITARVTRGTPRPPQPDPPRLLNWSKARTPQVMGGNGRQGGGDTRALWMWPHKVGLPERGPWWELDSFALGQLPACQALCKLRFPHKACSTSRSPFPIAIKGRTGHAALTLSQTVPRLSPLPQASGGEVFGAGSCLFSTSRARHTDGTR